MCAAPTALGLFGWETQPLRAGLRSGAPLALGKRYSDTAISEVELGEKKLTQRDQRKSTGGTEEERPASEGGPYKGEERGGKARAQAEACATG